jgi:hypothetical protein
MSTAWSPVKDLMCVANIKRHMVPTLFQGFLICESYVLIVYPRQRMRTRLRWHVPCLTCSAVPRQSIYRST